MANDVSNHVNYYIVIAQKNKDDLANIRHWQNLKVGFEGTQIWVKDFDYGQINALEVQTIPYKTVYDAREGKLHLHGSLLPNRNIPSLLWTPIDRAFSVKLPDFNHNFFGIEEKITMQLMPSDAEKTAEGMITTLDILKNYLETAPSVRLQKLRWSIINDDQVFVFGTPILPIEGTVFWRHKDFWIPTGFDFNLPILLDDWAEVINPKSDFFLVWQVDNTYFKINKKDTAALTLSSFRRSFSLL